MSGFDYLELICADRELPSDFILLFSGLFHPELTVVAGRVYIASLFREERHAELGRQGHSEPSKQFWMNLLEITGLFAQLSPREAVAVAERVVAAWNCRIRAELGEAATGQVAHVIVEQPTQEVFVSLGVADQGFGSAPSSGQGQS